MTEFAATAGVHLAEHQKLAEGLGGSEESRLILDGMAALVLARTPTGQIEFANQRALDFFGKTLEELNAWRTSDVVHSDDRDGVIADLKEIDEDEEPRDIDHRLRRHDGEYFWFRAIRRPARDSLGRVVRWYVVLTDVDERKKAEQRLEERERELREVLDAVPQMVTVYGPKRERLYANRGALTYYGTSLVEWQQGRMGSDFHPDDVERMGGVIARALAEGVAFDMETRLRKHDGTFRWFLARGNPVRDLQGQIARWYFATTDIDERKKSEDRLAQENVALREEVDQTSMFEEIVGASPGLTAVLSRVSKVAGSDSTVLITGETGTGKELVARAIHRRSGRSSGAFVAVNCAAVPRDLRNALPGRGRGALA